MEEREKQTAVGTQGPYPIAPTHYKALGNPPSVSTGMRATPVHQNDCVVAPDTNAKGQANGQPGLHWEFDAASNNSQAPNLDSNAGPFQITAWGRAIEPSVSLLEVCNGGNGAKPNGLGTANSFDQSPQTIGEGCNAVTTLFRELKIG